MEKNECMNVTKMQSKMLPQVDDPIAFNLQFRTARTLKKAPSYGGVRSPIELLFAQARLRCVHSSLVVVVSCETRGVIISTTRGGMCGT